MQIWESAIENWPFFWNVSPNLQSFLVFLYASSFYARQIFWSLSIAYNKVHLYIDSRLICFFDLCKKSKKKTYGICDYFYKVSIYALKVLFFKFLPKEN